MELIEDAGRVWHRLWSVRLAIVAAALGAVSTALPYVAPSHASPAYAAATGLVSLAAAVARLVAQPKVTRRG